MTLDFQIPSNIDAGREAQRRVLEPVLDLRYDPDSIFAIRLALEEGITNAIKHGNGLNPAKKVRIKATITDKRFEMTIEDEGPGFAKSKVPDPTANHNLGRPSGRGILLIESYMTSARWELGGRRLWMTRENNPKTTQPRK